MTPRVKRWKAFLSCGGFPERGTGRPVAVAVAELTFSMSCVSCHYFHNGPSFHREPLRRTSPSQDRDYSGRAAILSRERPGAFLAPSHPPLISSWTYRLALPPQAGGRTADEVGLSPVSVVSHFVQVTPPAL